MNKQAIADYYHAMSLTTLFLELRRLEKSGETAAFQIAFAVAVERDLVELAAE